MTEKSDLFKVLDELSRRYPGWRLGQLVANVAGWADDDIWDIDDERMLEAAKAHLNQLGSHTREVRAEAS